MNKFFYWFNYWSLLLGFSMLIGMLGNILLPVSIRLWIILPLCFLLGWNWTRNIWPRISKVMGFDKLIEK